MGYRNIDWILNKCSKEPGDFRLWKFVKVDGKYRFATQDAGHKSVMRDGEVPQAAGTISLSQKGWRMIDTSSMTLKVYAGDEEKEELKKLIPQPLLKGFGE